MSSPLAVSESQLLQLQFSECACELVCALSAVVRCACVRPSGFGRAITCTFVHGFQNNCA